MQDLPVAVNIHHKKTLSAGLELGGGMAMNKSFTPAKSGISFVVLLTTFGMFNDARAKDIDKAPMSKNKVVSEQPWVRYEDWPDARWDKFNTLNKQASPALGKIPPVTTPINGDANKGKELAFDRARGGSCVACHIMGKDTPELPGNVGPDLSNIGALRDDAILYNYIYDARQFNPSSVMPPWGAHGLFNDAEIKDIVTFLKTLKSPMVFKNSKDDPAKRAQPVEDRDNLDPIENPAVAAMERGEVIFKQKGSQGKACISCHAKPEIAFKQWAATMPQYSNKQRRVIGVEEFVARHAMATTSNTYLMQSDENISLAIYLRHLANGTPIQVVANSVDAKAAVARGEALSKRKIGQLNFACIDCHKTAANRWVRGQWLGESKGQTPHFPTWRTSRAEIWDIRKRFQWCNVAIRADELPPDATEYGDIELFLTLQNNGLLLNVPGIRH